MMMTVRYSERMQCLQCIRLHFVVLIPTLTSRHPSSNPVRQFFASYHKAPPTSKLPVFQSFNTGINGSRNLNSDEADNAPSTTVCNQTQSRTCFVQAPPSQSPFIQPNVKELRTYGEPPQVEHRSRLDAFQTGCQQKPVTSTSQANRSFSPLQAYQNHIASLQQRDECVGTRGYPIGLCSPMPQRKFGGGIVHSGPSSLPETRSQSETRWRSPAASPLPLRNQFQTEEPQYISGNTSPIILQRFYHQQKQQQMMKEVEECGKTDPCKKRFASYIKLQFSGDRSGRSSRHQSPEPPPRLHRGQSADGQSPLALRRAFLETHTPNSPSLSRRYVQPTPPVPPPRRLSESTSVPGSPQHLRARFHYTPEPQRRIFQSNDVS